MPGVCDYRGNFRIGGSKCCFSAPLPHLPMEGYSKAGCQSKNIQYSENDLRVKEGTGRRIPSDSEVSQTVRSFINQHQDLELGQPMN